MRQLRESSQSALTRGFRSIEGPQEPAFTTRESHVEAKTEFDVIPHKTSAWSRSRERKAAQRLPSASRRGGRPSPKLLLSSSRSKPVVSQATGINSMTPLGPTLSSMRSSSRTKMELQQQRHLVQQILSSNLKRNLQQSIEKKVQNLMDEPNKSKKQNMGATGQEQSKDSRFHKLKLKLSNEQRSKKESARFMHGMTPSSSR